MDDDEVSCVMGGGIDEYLREVIWEEYKMYVVY